MSNNSPNRTGDSFGDSATTLLGRFSPVKLTLSVAAGLVAVSYLTMWDLGGPRILAPYSLPVVVPALLGVGIVQSAGLGDAAEIAALAAAYLVVPALFLLWSSPLLRGREAVPMRSRILFGVVSIASFALLAIGWRDGYEWQGARYTLAMLAWNATAFVLVLAFLRKAQLRPAFSANLVFHGALFGWLAWCAFPWLGETL